MNRYGIAEPDAQGTACSGRTWGTDPPPDELKFAAAVSEAQGRKDLQTPAFRRVPRRRWAQGDRAEEELVCPACTPGSLCFGGSPDDEGIQKRAVRAEKGSSLS
jgi:hypothetical protein